MTTRAGKAGVWDADVLVLGAGAWGAMAAWRLAAAGADVLALDRHAPPHDRGSSHGLTRVFRVACLEHPGLADMALHSAQLYRELELDGDRRILDQCGGLTIGPERGVAIPGVLRAASEAGLSVEVLDAAQLRERQTFHTRIAPDDIGVHDPLSGALRIEDAVGQAVASATALGATVHSGVHILGISRILGGYRVTTDRGVYRAPRVVACLGSWTNEIFPDIPLKLTRMPMTWFAPSDSATDASIRQTGVFIREFAGGGGYWGHGAPEGELAKVGPRGAVARGDEPSVDDMDRAFAAADATPAERAVASFLPSLKPAAARGFICHSTRTPDEQFVLGEVGAGLIVAAGESGHGGKHAAAVGAAAAALALDSPLPFDIDFLQPTRFAGRAVALAT